MNNHIETEERKYFTIVPNIVDDIGLDPYAFRLYVHIRRVAGENGACWQSTETLAEICQMSTGRISKAKRTLQDAGLIRIETRTDNRKKYHHITVIDIWLKNITAYSPSEEARSPDELPSSPSEQHRSPGELKKNPIKNNHNEEESAADAASGDAPPDPPPEKPPKKPKPQPTAVQAAFAALAEVCAWEVSMLTSDQRGKLNRVSKTLREGGACADEIRQFAQYWREEDWRGKQGNYPDPYQVQKEWGRYQRWRHNGRDPARARGADAPQGATRAGGGQPRDGPAAGSGPSPPRGQLPEYKRKALERLRRGGSAGSAGTADV